LKTRQTGYKKLKARGISRSLSFLMPPLRVDCPWDTAEP